MEAESQMRMADALKDKNFQWTPELLFNVGTYLINLEAKYERAPAELLTIHKIACCGWGDAEPIQEGDTMTIRGVKEMAHYLNKWGDKLAARDEALKVAREALEETGLRWQSIVSALAKIEELIAK